MTLEFEDCLLAACLLAAWEVSEAQTGLNVAYLAVNTFGRVAVFNQWFRLDPLNHKQKIGGEGK